MSVIQAQAKYVRVAPRKARLVADLIRGMRADEAEAELYLLPKRAAAHLLKLLRSGIANAKEGKRDMETLYVKEIRVDGGPMLKRWRARARGSAGRIQKKTSHITIVLEEGKKKSKQTFVILKKEKEPKATIPAGKAKPKEKAEKEAEKKGAKGISGKKRFFQRKSV